MISDINNIQQSNFQPQLYQSQAYKSDAGDPLNSFADEDQAIISSEAKLLNELDKFNSGTGDLVNLAATSVMSKFTIEAEVNVINMKKDMIDAILDIGK